MHNAGHAILLVKGLISDQYKLWVQTCQLSRISRVAHEFEHHLTEVLSNLTNVQFCNLGYEIQHFSDFILLRNQTMTKN